jgi:hypothetical protein
MGKTGETRGRREPRGKGNMGGAPKGPSGVAVVASTTEYSGKCCLQPRGKLGCRRGADLKRGRERKGHTTRADVEFPSVVPTGPPHDHEAKISVDENVII